MIPPYVDPDEIRDRFNSITVWKKGGERAPHKPLLAIYAIGRALRGDARYLTAWRWASTGRRFTDRR
jgi:hypothetical protein